MDGEGTEVLELDGQVDGGAGEGEGGGAEEGHEGEGGEGGQERGGRREDLTPEQQQRKSAREYSQWLKGLKESDPASKRFISTARDQNARMFALSEIEPRGVDGIRETYALLNSLQHGEFSGVEALSALQDAARDAEGADQMIADGDPRVLELFGDDFNDGLAKLTGPILDRIADANPEAYAAAILPHLVGALRGSELVQSFNQMVDVLDQAPPSYLTAEQKQAWAQEQMRTVIGLASKMGQWFKAQADKAGALPKGGNQGGKGGQAKPDAATQRLQEAEKREQTYHWNTQIAPKTDKHAADTFSKMFAPYAKRLRLDQNATNSLRTEFVNRVVKKAVAKTQAGQDNPYVKQMNRYRSSRNPDSASVVNFFKVEFDKHAKTILPELINERYSRFLKGTSRQERHVGSGQTQGAKNRGPVAPNVTIVSVKPKNIDFKATPLEWLHQKKYRLTDGKVVQVRS